MQNTPHLPNMPTSGASSSTSSIGIEALIPPHVLRSSLPRTSRLTHSLNGEINQPVSLEEMGSPATIRPLHRR